MTDEVCYNIEIGVLDADDNLLQQGINAYILWSVAEWGRERGAKFYSMANSNRL